MWQKLLFSKRKNVEAKMCLGRFIFYSFGIPLKRSCTNQPTSSRSKIQRSNDQMRGWSHKTCLHCSLCILYFCARLSSPQILANSGLICTFLAFPRHKFYKKWRCFAWDSNPGRRWIHWTYCTRILTKVPRLLAFLCDKF